MPEDAKIVSVIVLALAASVSGGFGLWLLVDVVSGLGFGGLMLVAIPVGGLGLLCMICVVQISRILRQDSQFRQSTGNMAGPLLVVGSLSDEALLSSDHLYDIGFWRRPGKLHRVGSSGVSRDAAIQEIEAAFRRAGVEIVDVEANTNSELTVWRSVCRGSGMLEGRRLGGASIKKVLWQDG